MSEERLLEDKWIGDFKSFFKDQEKRFITKLKDHKKSAIGDLGIDVEDELQATITIIDPLIYATVMQGIKQASDLLQQPYIADLDFLKAWIAKVSEEIGTVINNTTIDAFNSSLTIGLESGEGIADLTKRVSEVFDFATDTRATMIARTETARGIAEAHRQTYDYYGYEHVDWLTYDACDECISKSLQKWTVDTIAGEIPVHPNCKCDFVPSVNNQ